MTTWDGMSSSEMEYDKSRSPRLQYVSITYVPTVKWTNLNSLFMVCVILTHMSSCPDCFPHPCWGFSFLKQWVKGMSSTAFPPAPLALLGDPRLYIEIGCVQPISAVANCLVFQLFDSHLSRSPSFFFRFVEGKEEEWPEVPCPKDVL